MLIFIKYIYVWLFGSGAIPGLMLELRLLKIIWGGVSSYF